MFLVLQASADLISVPAQPTAAGAGNRPDVPLRLVNGSSRAQGRLEALIDGAWTTAEAYYWGLNENVAPVVCRQLGLAGGRIRQNGQPGDKNSDTPIIWQITPGVPAGSFFGEGTINMTWRFGCNGNEARLEFCSKKWLGFGISGRTLDVVCNGEH